MLVMHIGNENRVAADTGNNEIIENVSISVLFSTSLRSYNDHGDGTRVK